MKLHDCPRNSLVRVLGDAPGGPGAPEINTNEVIKFYHTDGMYSYCKNEAGQVVHLLSEVEVLNEL